MTTTIVTAYFQLGKSKHNHPAYLEWMKNMLIIQCPMIIFCDTESARIISEFRVPSSEIYPTNIITMDITECYSYKYWQTFERQYNEKDHEKYHSPELYVVWNEKTNFLKRAVEINTFSTEYFLWTDIGCFREENTKFIHWPNPSKMKMLQDKILLLTVCPFTQEEYNCNTFDSIPDFQYTEGRIAAHIFGGTANAILRWHEQYYQLMDYFISIDRFVGKEQNIMSSMAILHKDMIELIETDYNCENIWFYLRNYLAY